MKKFSDLEMAEIEEILIKMQKRDYQLEKRVETLDQQLGTTIDLLDKATNELVRLVDWSNWLADGLAKRKILFLKKEEK